MQIREIETKQDIIDFAESFARKWSYFTTAEENVCFEIDNIYCYNADGWRPNDPSADDISDTQLNYVLFLIAALPDEQFASFTAHIAA